MEKVKRALQDFSLEVLGLEEVKDSYSSEVKIVTTSKGKFVLKIPYSKEKLAREVKTLALLKGKVKVPHLLKVSEEAFLMSHVDGISLGESIQEETAYKMGQVLGQLHQVKCPLFELEKGYEKDWWGGCKVRFEGWLDDIEGHVSSQILEGAKRAFAGYYKKLPPADGPCLIHFDYRPGNLLCGPDRELTLIDFESTRGGSADIDFTKVKLYLWDNYPHLKEVFIRGYESYRPLPDLDKTLPFYELFNGVGGLSWCVRRKTGKNSFWQENYAQVKKAIKGADLHE